MKHVIVGTAGHIDHGKSALVEALTGTNPDRLEEEKRRGITIDLGFAHLDLGGVRIGFVDVPGHERFVKNMLAGAGGIDLVLLVVAADESIKPQTREHFDICRLLGISNGLIVLTKADLVEREILDLVALEVQEYAARSFLEGAPIVPVSARTGEGLDTLKAELRRLALEVPGRRTDLPLRLPIDRAFVMKGFGAVVTGTLIAGEIRKDEEVEILPQGRRVRVRGIEVHNQPVDRALAGQRTALNLAGVEARDLERGMVIALPEVFVATDRLDCALTLLPSARPLKNRSKVHFHCWTAESLSEVVLLDTREIKPSERAYAQLRLAKPGLLLPGDRFIVRQFSPVTTIGGGVILDSRPSRHHAADARRLRFFQAVEQGDFRTRLEMLVQEVGEETPSALVARMGCPLAEVVRGARGLEASGRLWVFGEPPSLFVHPELFLELEQRMLEELERFHSANPLLSGVPKEELRGRAALPAADRKTPPSAGVFNSVLHKLIVQGSVASEGDLVRLAGQEIRLTAEEKAAQNQIASAFEKAGLAVPSAHEVLDSLAVDRGRALRILQILLKDRILVKVTEDLIFHHSALVRLREMLARRKEQSNRLSVTEFKDFTGLTRKYAIPLLEFLDRERVTRRQGDERIIL